MTKKLHRISVAQFCRKSLQNKYSYIFLAVLCCLGTFPLLAASKAKIQKSVVAKESLFQQILLTCRNMEKKVMAKADYSPEMKSLRAYHPAVERQKFQTVAAMVQKKEKLQAQEHLQRFLNDWRNKENRLWNGIMSFSVCRIKWSVM